MMQGGMFTPIPPAAATIAVASGRGYPRLTMDGIMIEPMAAVSAAEDPETPEKKIVATMTTCASPPRTWPTSTLAKRTSRAEMPPVSMNRPARTKKGTAKSGKESRPVNSFWAMSVRGMSPL